MHALEPLFELQPGQRSHPRHRHISLPGLARRPDVQKGGIQREPLRLVNRHRPGEAQRVLAKARRLGILTVKPPGEPLGTVYPLDGSKPVVIRAPQAGIVLVLRTFPRVHAGESIGVILEIQN